MSEGKRYYWLKLKEDFFTSKRIKKLRNQAGGDTYTIIYLKMQLLALRTDGILTWTGLEDNAAEELALDLDENPDDVSVTLMYLLKTGLAETNDNGRSFFLPWVVENTGNETAGAQRMREYRKRQALQSDAEALRSDTSVTQALRECCVEKEIEIEKDIELELEKEREAGKPPRSPAFKPPTVEEIAQYCRERNNGIDAQAFFDFYTGTNWFRGKTKIKDWKACVRTWERREREGPPKERRKSYVTAAEYKPPTQIDVGKLKALEELTNR